MTLSPGREDAPAKERPVLFSASMVRALLAGTKTQTRRVVKTSSGPHSIEQAVSTPDSLAAFIRSRCPYGQPGDRLWVREAHLIVGGPESKNPRVVYRATNDGPDAWVSPVWRPSIHMHRWVSRIQLEITEVRVERLQDISEADCVAEGMKPAQPDDDDARHMYSPKWAYEVLWDRLGGDWASNPWVWCVSFRVISPNPSAPLAPIGPKA